MVAKATKLLRETQERAGIALLLAVGFAALSLARWG
jgi:hypothetical protein